MIDIASVGPHDDSANTPASTLLKPTGMNAKYVLFRVAIVLSVVKYILADLVVHTLPQPEQTLCHLCDAGAALCAH